MKVTVKLFGNLGQHFPGYDPEVGMDVQIPDGARVKDLLVHLGTQGSKGLIVAAEGSLLRADDELENRGPVQIFQSVFGG
jgi:molybdopterin synthase sulfur carrier subunit